jgi:ubiquinone biosynthesis protein COQ9
MTDAPDATPDWADRAEQRLLDAALPRVREFGWTSRLLAAAAKDAGLSLGEAELVCPGGARDLAALLSRRHDAAALKALAAVDPASLKVRERIRRGAIERVEAAMADEAATRRLMGWFALPQNLALGGRLLWESADGLWRWAGDTSTDENHYSKRAILAGLLASTLAVRLSSSPAEAERHLDRGIEAVMAYEKAKARCAPADLSEKIAAALGKLRHGRAAPTESEVEAAG